MVTNFFEIIQKAIGLDTFSCVALFYMIIRGIIVYLVGIVLARFNKKLFGIHTPFNFILFIMLGSIFADSVIHVDIFLPTILTTVFLVLLNGFVTAMAFYIPWVERYIKGAPAIMVKNGEIQWHNMKKELVTERELLAELHRQLNTQDLSKVELAVLASDGIITFIKKA